MNSLQHIIPRLTQSYSLSFKLSMRLLSRDVERGGNPDVLKRELDHWGLFDYYEARSLNLFRRPR